MIWTSYFGAVRSKNLPNDKLVSIARWSPRGYLGDQFIWLAPPAELLRSSKNGLISHEQYIRIYIDQVLADLDINKVYNYLDGKILLCYERPEDFCHRHIVAAWFENSNLDCQEYDYNGDKSSWLI